MAKITTTVPGTKFDPTLETMSELQRLGLKPTVQVQEFGLAAQQDRLNSFSDIDVTEFKPDSSLFGSDEEARPLLEEQRAREQGVLNQAMKGIGRIGSTMLTEVLKTPGYLGGALGSAAIEGDFIENTVNNAWVNAFESMDESIKEAMPVYLTKEVQEGGIGSKLMSSAWWATTGADGVGFLLSMYMPGQFLKAMNIGSYMAKGVEGMAKLAGAESKFTKVLTANNILKETLAGVKATDKTISGLQSSASVALNTFVESSAEAANTFDNVRKTYLEQNPNATDEEARQIAGNAAASVMKANIGVLAMSNVLDEIFLFKGFNQGAEKAAKESILGKLFTDGKFDTEVISKLKREGIKEFGKKALPKLVANFAKEGMFEEGLQTRIQQHYENVASGKTEAGFWEDVIGGYVEGLFNDPEMQESVVLGGILGGGASMVGLAGEIKGRNDLLFGKSDNYPSFLAKVLNQNEKTQSPGLLKLLEDNFVNSFRTVHDIAQTGSDGKPVFENGKIKLDEAKLKDMVEQKQNTLLLNQLHNIAILEGNQAEEDMYGDQLAFNYFLPFLQQEGGYEVLKQHIETQLVDLMAKKVEDATGTPPSDQDKQGIKAKLNKRADEFNAIYQDVHRTTNTEMHVAPKNKNYGAWKQSVRDRKMQSLLQYNSATKALTEINKKFPVELTDEELATLNPVQIIEYARAKKQRKDYEEFANKAKEKYVQLSSGKGLKEDYENYNKKIEEINTKVAEEVAKEAQPVENIQSSQDFENSIVSGGYETIRNSNMKGFYIKGERLIVENDKGQRGMVESVYDPKLQRTDQYFINSAGKRTKITDENGNITETFLKTGFKPISKTQLSAERKQLAIKERKETQLALLQELIDYRNKSIGSTEREIADIEKQIEDYTEQLKKAQEEIVSLFDTKKSNRARNLKKKQLKAQRETLEATITSIENTIENLQKRRDVLYETIPRIEAIRDEYIKLQKEVEENDSFSFKQELKKTEEAVIADKDINDIKTLITDIESKITYLTDVKDSILRVLASHKVFIKMIQLTEKEYTKAFTAFDKFFEGVPIPYGIRNIHNHIVQDLKETVAGETLAKNNIITNAIEIAEWFNNNPEQRLSKFGTNEPINEEDIYDKIVELISPYAQSFEELQKNSPLTLEDIHDMQARVFITNRELNDLNNKLEESKELLNVSDLYRRYIVLQRLVQDKVEKRYNELRNEKAEKTLDFSQKQRGSFPEPGEETDMRDVFYQHALPSTPFSTTGISVLYEKEGVRKGKDKIGEEGYPELNDNEFQRLWFLTIDKLSDEATEYMLMPVRAKYDSSDDFQKAIEANFPNESQRSKDDVFVFLVNKEGKPVRADKQGNFLKEGGNFVFTSVRKADEVYPTGKKPKIAPDYILNEYLKSIGITNAAFTYEKIKDKKVADLSGSKTFINTMKQYIDADKTVGDLFNDAIAWNKEQYQKFVDGLGTKPGFLEIAGTTRGYPLYQLDKNGKKKQNKPLAVFKNVKLGKELGDKQLEGATLGVTIRGPLKSKGQLIQLPEGTIYIKFQNEEFVTLQSRNINKDEAKTIMFLLSLADTQNPLNSITIPFPKKKDGTSYYYQFGKQRVQETMPIFARRLETGEPFSLLHTLINYGFKSEGKNKKGEIYIQYGKLNYTDFNGQSHQLNLKELSDAIASDKFEKHSDTVADLFNFLLQKRFNVEKNLLKTNPTFFMYPKLRKLKNGQYDVEFEYNKTYYDFMLNDVLTTSATRKEGYPNHLQRNVVYSPEIVERKTNPEKPTTTQNGKATASKPPKMNEQKTNVKENWMAQKRVSVNNLRTIVPEYLEDEDAAKNMFYTKFKPQLEDQAKQLSITITEEDINELFYTYFRGAQNKPAPEGLENILPEDTKTDERFINERKPQWVDDLIDTRVKIATNLGITKERVEQLNNQDLTAVQISSQLIKEIPSLSNYKLDEDYPAGNKSVQELVRAVRAKFGMKSLDDKRDESSESEKKLTPQEKLAARRAQTKQVLQPKAGMAKPTPKDSADKLVDVNKLIDEYIEQGIVQKQCK